MLRFPRAAALAVGASLAAACSGHSGAGIPQTPQTHQLSPNVPNPGPVRGLFTRTTDDGYVVHYFPTLAQASSARATLSARPNVSNLLYGGGPIQNAPKVYVVFWGSTWNSTTGDPHHVATLLKSFLGGLNGSQWTSTMTQYYGPTGTYVGNDTVLAGTYVDTSSTPARHPSDGSIGTEAKKAAAHFGDYSVNASYVVALPHGHDPSAFATSWCAWHNSESATGGVIAYTDLPYMPDGGGNCGSGSVNSPGTNDGVSIVEGHEQGETETDPQPPSGWTDVRGNEIGDKCAWLNLRNTAFSTGTYPTQPLWSNKNGGCVQ